MPSNLNVFGFSIQLGLKDMASPGLLSISKSLATASAGAKSAQVAIDRLRNSANQMGMTAIGLGLASQKLSSFGDNVFKSLDSATVASAEFSLELARLKFTASATKEEMSGMVDIINKMGRSSIYSGKDITKGAYELVSAGLNLAQAKQALESTLNFSTISGGQVGIEQSAKMFGAIFNKFRIAPSESKRVSDILTQASNKSAFTFADLPRFMNSLQDAPTKMNAPLEELTAMGMALRNAGQNPREAGQKVASFGNALLNITAQIDRAAIREKEGKKQGSIQQYRMNLLKKIGFGETQIWDSKGRMRSMVDIMSDLIKNSAGLTEQVKSVAKKTVFAQNASVIWSVMEKLTTPLKIWNQVAGKWEDNPLSKGSSFKEMVTNLMKGSEGKTDEGMVLYMKELQNKMAMLDNTVKQLGIHWGQSFAPFKTFDTEVKQKIVAGMDEILVKFPELGVAVAGITALLGGLSKAAGIALGAIAGLAIAGAGIKYMAADMLEYGMGQNAKALLGLSPAKQAALVTAGNLPFNTLSNMQSVSTKTAANALLSKQIAASVRNAKKAGIIEGTASLKALKEQLAMSTGANATILANIIAQKEQLVADKASLKTLIKGGGAATNWKEFFKEFITKGWALVVPYLKIAWGWIAKIGLMAATIGFVWTTNLFGIRTGIEKLFTSAKKGADIAGMSLDNFNETLKTLDKGSDYSIKNWTKFYVLWDSLQSYWSTGLIPIDSVEKLNKTNMAGIFNWFVELDIKSKEIGKGFSETNRAFIAMIDEYDRSLGSNMSSGVKLLLNGPGMTGRTYWKQLGSDLYTVAGVAAVLFGAASLANMITWFTTLTGQIFLVVGSIALLVAAISIITGMTKAAGNTVVSADTQELTNKGIPNPEKVRKILVDNVGEFTPIGGNLISNKRPFYLDYPTDPLTGRLIPFQNKKGQTNAFNSPYLAKYANIGYIKAYKEIRDTLPDSWRALQPYLDKSMVAEITGAKYTPTSFIGPMDKSKTQEALREKNLRIPSTNSRVDINLNIKSDESTFTNEQVTIMAEKVKKFLEVNNTTSVKLKTGGINLPTWAQ